MENKHLLVFRFSSLGDVAMTIPVIRVLHKTYPHIKISVVTKKIYAPIFQCLEYLNIIPLHPEKGIKGIYSLGKFLNKKDIDYVADLHQVIRSKILCLFLIKKGIKIRRVDKGRKEKKKLINPKNNFFKPLKSTHQRYADVFGQLGFPINIHQKLNQIETNLPPLFLKTNSDKEHKKKWIGLAPFAKHKGKTYPFELIKKLTKKLSQEEDYIIHLLGAVKEEITELNKLTTQKNIHCIAGKYSLKEELAIINQLDVMISMDSGNAHLASMFDVVTIVLWGVTHPYAGFAPFNHQEQNSILSDRTKFPKIPTSIYGDIIPENYENVMYSIDTEEILSKVKNIFSEHPKIKKR